jgi:phenylacetate-coenzyme A ligase PaaK-like adenylate-forming protein
LKEPVKNIDLEKRIFAASPANFKVLAMELFQYQYQHNDIYRQFCNSLNTDPARVDDIRSIPYLPISLFKTHRVTTTSFAEEAIFESSGTTQQTSSKHFIKDLSLYRQSFENGFRKFYGEPFNKCIIGLLPSYLERQNSSLVFMVDALIRESAQPLSGFYLTDHEKLHRTLLHNEIRKQPTLLFGVTYALLDFAEQYPMQLRHTTVIETGGMKGRREELTRQEVHRRLQEQLGLSLVHSEYGMTELLSQAWSKGDGIFHCPPWMKVLVRDEDDPLHVQCGADVKDRPVSGVINCIDLANIYSCAFIATDDMGRLYANESFEVLGRVDNSDIRGCSLMTI